MVNGKSFRVYILWKWLRKTIRKSDCFQEIPARKKVPFLKK